MHFFFIDDSRQTAASRPKMGTMIAVGGVICRDAALKPVNDDIDALCQGYGFPHGQKFKWSPGPELWMRKNLVRETRLSFQEQAIDILAKHDCRTVFVAVDENCRHAHNASTSHQMDVSNLLIERADWYFEQQNEIGAIVVDRSGGDMKQEEEFLLRCLDALRAGTDYRTPTRIVLPILSAPSTTSRLLQLADLITGCTLAFVSGENVYSPPLMKRIIPLFLRHNDRVGGVGVKLHPYLKYANLYHWLFGDTHYWRMNMGVPMPLKNIAFSKSPDEY